MSFKTTGNDSDDGYRFHLTNDKTLVNTRNCDLKSRALTEGDYGLKDIADLLLGKHIIDVLRIKLTQMIAKIKRVASCR